MSRCACARASDTWFNVPECSDQVISWKCLGGVPILFALVMAGDRNRVSRSRIKHFHMGPAMRNGFVMLLSLQFLEMTGYEMKQDIYRQYAHLSVVQAYCVSILWSDL